MKPPPFDYHSPASVQEATAVLLHYASDASVLAGGQSLIPLLNMRMARPAAVVDIGRVPGLDYVERRNGEVAVGAMTPQRTVLESEQAREGCPLLAQGLRHVGHTPIRSRGTVGGSIAHADPAAELPAVLIALDGSVRCHGPSGERVIAADEFFQGFLTTALVVGEIVTEVSFSALPAGSGSAFEEVARRHGDFALAGVAAAVTLRGGRCTAAHLGLAGVALTPVKPREVEAALVGTDLSDEAIAGAARDVARGLSPSSDLHADADFRIHLTTVLTERALRLARRRAAGGTDE